MTPDSASILHDLDLLDDWLAGKGYGEEAGLVLRAMTLINAQARELRELRSLLVENEKLRAERDTIGEANYVSGWNDAINSSEAMQDLRAENEKLREALKPFADEASVGPMPGEPDDPRRCNMKFLRAAAAALKETGD